MERVTTKTEVIPAKESGGDMGKKIVFKLAQSKESMTILGNIIASGHNVETFMMEYKKIEKKLEETKNKKE